MVPSSALKLAVDRPGWRSIANVAVAPKAAPTFPGSGHPTRPGTMTSGRRPGFQVGCGQAELATELRKAVVTPHVPMLPIAPYQRRPSPVAPHAPGIRFQSGAPLKAGRCRGCGQPQPSRAADIIIGLVARYPPRHKRGSWVGPGRTRKSTWPGPSGVSELTPFEFLDRLAALIPPTRRHRHRYHGVFTPNHPPEAGRHDACRREYWQVAGSEDGRICRCLGYRGRRLQRFG